MRHFICLVLLLFIPPFFKMTCSALKRSDYTFRGISISGYDYRLFSYEDSVQVNKHLIESLLRRISGIGKSVEDIVEDGLNIPDGRPQLTPSNLTDGEEIIIHIANEFVKDGYPITPHFAYTQTKVNKRDKEKNLIRLYESFSRIQSIEGKDIIDVININKQINQLHEIEIIEASCYPINRFFDYTIYNDEYGEIDSLYCELNKITRKYINAGGESSTCEKRFFILESTELSINEKIEVLTCMIEKLNVYRLHDGYDRYETILDARIRRWEKAVDSLQTILSRQN